MRLKQAASAVLVFALARREDSVLDAALEQREDYPRLGLWNAGGPYVGLGGTLAYRRVSAYSLALASRAAPALGGALDFKLAGLYPWSGPPDCQAPSYLPSVVPNLGIVEPWSVGTRCS